MVPVELGGLADGRHVVRVIVRNGGPFGATLATERRATVRVDRTPPTVARATFTPGAGGLTAAWVADDALAGVEAATVQWRDGAAWRTLASQRAVDGSGSMAVDVSSVPLGERVLRVVITDARRERRGAPGRGAHRAGRSRAAPPPIRSRGSGARASRCASRGARRAAPGGRPVARRTDRRRRDRHHHRPPPGRARARAIAGAEIRARGHRGDGRRTRADAPGRALPARRAPRGRRPADDRGPGRARAAAVPRRAAGASSRSARASAWPRRSTAAAAGQEVLFTGRLVPAPADIGLGSRKGVVLEWLDPVRRTWRPVVNARIAKNGTFAIPWSFALRGLTIPMRASVPTEVGWPLLPVAIGGDPRDGEVACRAHEIRRQPCLAALAALALSPAMGIGAPSLSDPALSPSCLEHAARRHWRGWTSERLRARPAGPAPRSGEPRADGTHQSALGRRRPTVAGPLVTGVRLGRARRR